MLLNDFLLPDSDPGGQIDTDPTGSGSTSLPSGDGVRCALPTLPLLD